jgi:hypothetical protein
MACTIPDVKYQVQPQSQRQVDANLPIKKTVCIQAVINQLLSVYQPTSTHVNIILLTPAYRVIVTPNNTLVHHAACIMSNSNFHP